MSTLVSTREIDEISQGVEARAQGRESNFKRIGSTSTYKLMNDKEKRVLSGSKYGLSKLALEVYKTNESELEKKLVKHNDEGIEIWKSNLRKETKNTLMDRRMGPSVEGVKCETCNLPLGQCAGHPGRIELAVPVIMGDTYYLKKVFECICIDPNCRTLCHAKERCACGKATSSVEIITSKQIMKEKYDGVKIEAKIKKNVPLGIKIKRTEKCTKTKARTLEPVDLYPSEIRSILLDIEKKYPEDIAPKTKLANISGLCSRVLIVPPPAYRQDKGQFMPSSGILEIGECTNAYERVMAANKSAWTQYWVELSQFEKDMEKKRQACIQNEIDVNGMTDEIVTKCFGIIKSKARMMAKELGGTPNTTRTETSTELATAIYDLFNGFEAVKKDEEQFEGDTFNGLWQMIAGSKNVKSKHALVKKYLLGKNVSSAARGIILGDSSLPHTSIGVPKSFMQKLSLEVGINSINVEEIHRELKYPSMSLGRFIEVRSTHTTPGYKGKNRYNLHRITEEDKTILEEMLKSKNCGCRFVGRRLLRDGDIVIANRQPTLQRSNMQALRVVAVDGDCLIINPEQAKAYNLDFDGDAMNIFVPQDEISRAEMSVLNSPIMLIVNANGKSILGPGPSTSLGLFILTDPAYHTNTCDGALSMFKCLFASLKESDYEILKPQHMDESVLVDKEIIYQASRPLNMRSAFLRSLKRIRESKSPWRCAVLCVLSLCMPFGMNTAIHRPKQSTRYRRDRTVRRYKADHLKLSAGWGILFSNEHVKYIVASVNENDQIIGMYIETDSNDPVNFNDVDEISSSVPQGAQTVSFGGSDDVMYESDCTMQKLNISNGEVTHAPQLDGEIIHELYSRMLYCGGGECVLAAMGSLQRIAHAIMSFMETASSSPCDLFNAVHRRTAFIANTTVSNEIMKMATTGDSCILGKMINGITLDLYKFKQQIMKNLPIDHDLWKVVESLSKPDKLYVLSDVTPEMIHLKYLGEDKGEMVTHRLLNMEDMSTILERYSKLSFDWKSAMYLVCNSDDKQQLWKYVWKNHKDSVLKWWEGLSTPLKIEPLIGLRCEDVKEYCYALNDGDQSDTLIQLVNKKKRETLKKCHSAIQKGVLPHETWRGIADTNKTGLVHARLVPADALDGSTICKGSSVEGLVTGGTLMCVKAKAQFPKGTKKDLMNMGVCIGDIKAINTTKIDPVVASTPQEMGFISDNYITGIKNFPNFIQSQQIGIKSELTGKKGVAEMGYDNRKLILAHMSIVAGMHGEARYLAGKGRERIVQFRYGGDGQDPHKLIAYNTVDIDAKVGELAANITKEVANLEIASSDDILVQICEYAGYAAGMAVMLNAGTERKANRAVRREMGNCHDRYSNTADKIKHDSERLGLLGNGDDSAMTQRRKGLSEGALIANGSLEGEISRLMDDIQSIAQSEIRELKTRLNTADVEDANKRKQLSEYRKKTEQWFGEALDSTINPDIDVHIIAMYDKVIEMGYDPYIAGEALGLAMLTSGPTIDTQNTFEEAAGLYLTHVARKVGNVMLVREETSNKEGFMYDVAKAIAAIISHGCKGVMDSTPNTLQPRTSVDIDDAILLARRSAQTESEMWKGELFDYAGEEIHRKLKHHEEIAIKPAAVATLQRKIEHLPCKHIALLMQCKDAIQYDFKDTERTAILAFTCIVMNRLEYARVEYGAPIGGWAIEALVADLQQAALDTKHSGSSANSRFKEFVEFSPSKNAIIRIENGGSDIMALQHRRQKDDLVSYSRLYYTNDTLTDGISLGCTGAGVRLKFKTSHLASICKDELNELLKSLDRSESNEYGKCAMEITIEDTDNTAVHAYAHYERNQPQTIDNNDLKKAVTDLQHFGNMSDDDIVNRLQGEYHSRDGIETILWENETQVQKNNTMIEDILSDIEGVIKNKFLNNMQTVSQSISGLDHISIDDFGNCDITFTGAHKEKQNHKSTEKSVLLELANHLGTQSVESMYSDNPVLVHAAYGVEVSRLVMRQELDQLFANSDADPRHIQLLADTATVDGFMRGITKRDSETTRSPLEILLFEQGRKELNRVAMMPPTTYDEDAVHVSAMYNRPPQIGTGVIGVDTRNDAHCDNLMSVITQDQTVAKKRKADTDTGGPEGLRNKLSRLI